VSTLSLHKLVQYKEVLECATLSDDNYDDEFYSPNKNLFTKNLWDSIQRGDWAVCIKQYGRIVAYGIATAGRPYMHSNVRCLNQSYYHSILEGVLAVRALRLFHQSMIEEGQRIGVELVQSQSVLDNYETFNKILAREGWSRRGPMMVRRIRNPLN